MSTERMTAADYRASLKPAPSKAKAPNASTEDDIQKTLVAALRQCGYIVLETGQDRSHLQGQLMRAIRPFLRGDIAEAFIFNLLGKILRQWGNNDAGLPDLLVTHDDWHGATFIGIELKTRTGKIRAEQQALLDKGRIIVCRSVEEGIEAVLDVDSIEGRSAWGDPVKLRRMQRDFKEQTT